MWGNIVKNMSKYLSSKYSQKLLDHAKQPPTDTFKTASKKSNSKNTEAAGVFTGNKIANKITRASKTSP